MTKSEFLRRLEKALAPLGAQERQAALEYWEEYIAEAAEEDGEEAAIANIDAPEDIARRLLAEAGMAPAPRKKTFCFLLGAARHGFAHLAPPGRGSLRHRILRPDRPGAARAHARAHRANAFGERVVRRGVGLYGSARRDHIRLHRGCWPRGPGRWRAARVRRFPAAAPHFRVA